MKQMEAVFLTKPNPETAAGYQKMEKDLGELGLESLRVTWVIGKGWTVASQQNLWLDAETLKENFIKNRQEDLVEALGDIRNIKKMEENYGHSTDRRFEFWCSFDTKSSDIYIETAEESPLRTEQQSKENFDEVLTKIGWTNEREQLKLKEVFSPSEAIHYRGELYTRYDKEKDDSFKKIADYLYEKVNEIKNELEKEIAEHQSQ